MTRARFHDSRSLEFDFKTDTNTNGKKDGKKDGKREGKNEPEKPRVETTSGGGKVFYDLRRSDGDDRWSTRRDD